MRYGRSSRWLVCSPGDSTLTGFRYPLRRHCLKAEDCGLTVSNEITEDSAKVEFESGSLLMLMTRD